MFQDLHTEHVTIVSRDWRMPTTYHPEAVHKTEHTKFKIHKWGKEYIMADVFLPLGEHLCQNVLSVSCSLIPRVQKNKYINTQLRRYGVYWETMRAFVSQQMIWDFHINRENEVWYVSSSSAIFCLPRNVLRIIFVQKPAVDITDWLGDTLFCTDTWDTMKLYRVHFCLSFQTCSCVSLRKRIKRKTKQNTAKAKKKMLWHFNYLCLKKCANSLNTYIKI